MISKKILFIAIAVCSVIAISVTYIFVSENIQAEKNHKTRENFHRGEFKKTIVPDYTF